MRVISGTERGRKLISPEGDDIRPTTDSVKEAIFNILAYDIEGRTVLDLFAGTGQLGIEALSRGASKVVFVDSSLKSLKLVKNNLDVCKFNSEVVNSDSLQYLQRCDKFDIIIIDPPYDSGLYDEVLYSIAKFDLIKKNGIILVESKKECVLPDLDLPYVLSKVYKYGKIKITKYIRE